MTLKSILTICNAIEQSVNNIDHKRQNVDYNGIPKQQLAYYKGPTFTAKKDGLNIFRNILQEPFVNYGCRQF